MIGFALCHGWAFDAQAMEVFAANLRRHFPDSPVVAFDLGFTGKPQAPFPDIASSKDTRWIALGHSYGFAWLMQQELAWHATVSVNGFTRFCRRPGKPEGTPVRLVDAMIARLDSEPQATVEEFRRRCGGMHTAAEAAWPSHDARLDVPLLGAHLRQLRDLDLSLSGIPILALSTREDVIVPPSLTHACFAHAHCTIEEYEGSHLRLLQEPAQCMAAIRTFVEANRG
ncbi:MAG: alpha/beta fold hydrolase [Burkholderiaceae bacterium]